MQHAVEVEQVEGVTVIVYVIMRYSGIRFGECVGTEPRQVAAGVSKRSQLGGSVPDHYAPSISRPSER